MIALSGAWLEWMLESTSILIHIQPPCNHCLQIWIVIETNSDDIALITFMYTMTSNTDEHIIILGSRSDYQLSLPPPQCRVLLHVLLT